MKLLHESTLPIALSNSNDGQGRAWYRAAKNRNRFERELADHKRTPFSVPTMVEVIRILGPRQRKWDASSGLRGNYKELEDALVALGWWHDDGPDWILRVTFDQDSEQRENGPAVQIRIWGCE